MTSFLVKIYVTEMNGDKIAKALCGPAVVEPPQYVYYFEVDSWAVAEDLTNYKVINGELTHAN